jgi:hypothetical protein
MAQDGEQLAFPDPSFIVHDPGWCGFCQSRDRLLASCLFKHHGGDDQAYRRICTCEPGTGRFCYLHERRV